MAGYELNAPYTYGGGSAILPQYWAGRLPTALRTHGIWARFATPVVIDQPLLDRGAGYRCNWSHTTDITIGSDLGTLTEGTSIPSGSNTLINGYADIKEFGKHLPAPGFPMWLCDPGYQALAPTPQSKQAENSVNALLNWGVKIWDRYIGIAAISTGINFAVRSATTSLYGAVASGTAGTAALTPATLSQLRGYLGRAGIEPREDLGNRYGFMVPVGGADWLVNTDAAKRDSASLGLADPYKSGFVGEYGGFVFFEEFGQNGVLTYSTTSGTACVFGNDAIAANTNMGEEPNYLLYYPDVGNDSGRHKQTNIYFLGIAAPMVAGSSASYVRSCTVNYAM